MPGFLKYIPAHEVDARHRQNTRPMSSSRGLPQGEQRNVEAILSLGSTRYFTYRHYVFCVPPVPFLFGQKLLALYIRVLADAKQVAVTGDKAASESYFRNLTKLSKMIWSHVQPLGPVRRTLKRFGLMRNKFRGASEKEIQDITNFFLQGRMMSSVQATEMESPVGQSIQMSSTNSKSS